MLLGAGFGRRLRPLTAECPKPLVPVGLKPLLDWHLEALHALDVSLVALNVSYLAERIENHVEDRVLRPPRVAVLREEEPLGVGGGLMGARELLKDEDRFLVLNADVFHRIDLGDVLSAHDRRGADATLVIRRAGPGEAPDELHVTEDGLVTGVPGMGRPATGWRFAGIHVLKPSVFEHLSAPGPLFAGYRGLLAAGATVLGFDCGAATWFDVGTPRAYLDANRAATRLAAGATPVRPGVRIEAPALVADSAAIGGGCSIGPGTSIGAGASVGAGSRLSDTVVWPGVTIPPGSELRDCVAYPGGLLNVP